MDPATGMPGMPLPVTQYLESRGQNVPVTPQDMEATAEPLATAWLGLPEGIKDSELRKLKMHNAVLHSVVKQKMSERRQSTRMQGGAMLMQQQGMTG